MPREDSLSSRFDYLFEPLDAEESVHDADPTGAVAGVSDEDGRPDGAPVRMAFAAFVLASLGAVAVVAVLLLQQPDVMQYPGTGPVQPAPLPTTVADVPSLATVSPPPDVTADDQPPQPIESVPPQQVLPAPPQPTQTPRAPQGGMPNSPTTRAPISVAPQSRPPFPNQGSRPGGNGAGGLLGGLL